jgi:uncharacterized membrane protein
MRHKKYLLFVFPFILAGTAFSGYLSGVKLFNGTCALNESCAYFLGYPACFFGFALFASMLVITAVAIFSNNSRKWIVPANLAISALGSLFAGYFSTKILINYFSTSTLNYALVLPTCIYGFLFFFIIFIISLVAFKKRNF